MILGVVYRLNDTDGVVYNFVGDTFGKITHMEVFGCADLSLDTLCAGDYMVKRCVLW
jgi:hypothetical protein